MELREYLGIFIRRWWVIIPTILIALTGSMLFSYSQTPIYEANSTFVAAYSSDAVTDRDTFIDGLEALTNQEGIFITYCEIFKSASVRLEVSRVLAVDPNSGVLDDYTVSCSKLPETNVLLLTAQGPSRALLENMSKATGLVGMARTNSLYLYFPLTPLDDVALEDSPVSPNHKQNAALGGAFGVLLGIGAALMIEYLRRPGERIAAMSIRHPQIGIYNDAYFERRAQEELQRAHIRNRPISMALLRILPDEDFFLMPKSAQNILIRKLALLLEHKVDHGSLIAYLRPMLIGVLLIETPGGAANAVVEQLQDAVRSQPFQAEGGYQTTFSARAGIVASSGSLMSYREMYEAAQDALKGLEVDSGSQINLVHGVPRPFMDEDNGGDVPEDRVRKSSKSSDPFTTNEDVM